MFNFFGEKKKNISETKTIKFLLNNTLQIIKIIMNEIKLGEKIFYGKSALENIINGCMDFFG